MPDAHHVHTAWLHKRASGRLRQHEDLGMHVGLQRHIQKAEPIESLRRFGFETANRRIETSLRNRTNEMAGMST